MPDPALIYRDQLVRCTIGMRPAMIARPANPTELNRFSHALADHELAKQLLCAKGYGFPSQSLADLVRALPPAVKP